MNSPGFGERRRRAVLSAALLISILLAAFACGNMPGSAAATDASAPDGGDASSSPCPDVPSQTCDGCEVDPPAGAALKCFELSPTYSVCGSIVKPEEPTECNGTSVLSDAGAGLNDECGCNGTTCGPGESCVKVYFPAPSALGGPGYAENHCLQLCTSNADCSDGKVCFPRSEGEPAQCVEPTWECTTDTDCIEDECGGCVRTAVAGHAGTINVYATPRCYYPGVCTDASCDTCAYSYIPLDGHICL